MKGIQCNVAAQVEGALNTSEQSILNEITTKPRKSNTKTLKKKKKGLKRDLYKP